MRTFYTLLIYLALWLLPTKMVARQLVWQNVKTYWTNQSLLEVTGVTVNDTATLVTISAKGKYNSFFTLRECCHLRDEQGRVYSVRGGLGIELNQRNWLDGRGEQTFVLWFEPLADDVRTIDFVESELHRERVLMLGIAEEGKVEASRYEQRSIKGMFPCQRSFGSGKATLHGRLESYVAGQDHPSIFLCDETVLTDEASRPFASCHIHQDGTFTLTAEVQRAALLFLTSEMDEQTWQIPVFVHPSDDVHLTVNLREGRITAYQSKCKKDHLQAMQEVGVLGNDFCQPRMIRAPFSLTATYDSPSVKGKAIIASLTRQYRGKYVEFVGLSAKTMVPTLNLLSNIRYDFYRHPDIQLVYLFDGRSVKADYYQKFVERYLDDEDTHLLNADDFAAVREFLLSRESSLVATLNREGFPLVNPLNYNDEYEFRRRFRMMLHAESDAMSEEELVMIDTMVEVPDSFSLVYDREHTHGAGSTLIPQHQAQTEHRMLWMTWWGIGLLVLTGGVLWVRRKKTQPRPPDPQTPSSLPLEGEGSYSVNEIPKSQDSTPPLGEVREGSESGEGPESGEGSGTGFWDNLIAAWAAKKPKNAVFLAKLNAECPSLTKREQAMCLIYYSEDLPDDKMMEILEIPSPQAYRTAKSRLRKKLKDVKLKEIQNLSL